MVSFHKRFNDANNKQRREVSGAGERRWKGAKFQAFVYCCYGMKRNAHMIKLSANRKSNKTRG